MRDLKELHWRSRGPQLPQTVLDAATLRIGAPLPETYRLFLSQVDGGRIGRGAFTAAEKNWQIGGFFPFADAAGLAEKLRKSGKLPQGYLPVAYAESPEKPLIYLELAAAGRMFLKPSAKSRWEDAGSVLRLGDSFAEFLDLLGDVSKDPAVVVNTDSLAAAPAPVAAAPAPVAAAKPKAAAKPAAPAAKPITSPAAAAARAFAAAASAKNAAPATNHKLTPPAAKPTKLPAKASAKPAPAASKASAKKAPAKKVAKAASAKAASKPTKPAAKKKPAAKAAKAKPAKAKVGARSRR